MCDPNDYHGRSQGQSCTEANGLIMSTVWYVVKVVYGDLILPSFNLGW